MPPTVLIGPPGAGKSTVGPLVAELTGRVFVDADEAATPWYAAAGWSVERLRARSEQIGLEEAHREWEVALVAAVVGLASEHDGAVLALGAGHTHVTDPRLFGEVERALVGADVVLLRPAADGVRSLAVLRERCQRSKGHGWVVDGVDWLERWLTDGLDEHLATRTALTQGQGPEGTARRVTVGF